MDGKGARVWVCAVGGAFAVTSVPFVGGLSKTIAVDESKEDNREQRTIAWMGGPDDLVSLVF